MKRNQTIDEVKQISEHQMYGFDELPLVIKRALQEFDVDATPAQIWQMLMKGAPPELIAIKITQRSRRLFRGLFLKGTGREYPDE